MSRRPSATQLEYLRRVAASHAYGHEGAATMPQPSMRSRRSFDALLRLELVEAFEPAGGVYPLVRLTDAGRALLEEPAAPPVGRVSPVMREVLAEVAAHPGHGDRHPAGTLAFVDIRYRPTLGALRRRGLLEPHPDAPSHGRLTAAGRALLEPESSTRGPVRSTVEGPRTAAPREEPDMPKATAAERIAQAAADVAAIADPAEQALVATKALAALAGAGISLKETRHKATEKLKADGWTLAQLGEHLGMSRSRAQQVVGGLSRSTASRSTPASKRGGTSAEAASS